MSTKSGTTAGSRMQWRTGTTRADFCHAQARTIASEPNHRQAIAEKEWTYKYIFQELVVSYGVFSNMLMCGRIRFSNTVYYMPISTSGLMTVLQLPRYAPFISWTFTCIQCFHKFLSHIKVNYSIFFGIQLLQRVLDDNRRLLNWSYFRKLLDLPKYK